MWSVVGFVDSNEINHLVVVSEHLINSRKMPLIPIVEAMLDNRLEELGFQSEIGVGGVKEVLLTTSDSYQSFSR